MPVICSDAGGLPENIEDGVTGLLFHRRDALEMAEKIVTLLDNPKRRMVMGLAGRKRAIEHFSLAQGTTQFLNLYENITKG